MPEHAGAGWRRTIAAGLFVTLVVAPLVAVGVASTALFRPGGRILEIEMRTTSGDTAQVYWSAGYVFSGEAMASVPINQVPGEFARLRFRIPDERFELIRVDPMNGSGEAVVRSMRVLDDRGREVRAIDPIVLSPLHEVTRITRGADGVRILTTEGATDPIVMMRASWLSGPSPWRPLQFVTPLALTWIGLASLALIAAAAAVVLRDARRDAFDFRAALWLATLFLTVLWAKAVLLQDYPVPVPFWDQWDGEAATLYIPWWHDGLTWRQMFTLHNEHRIFFSRVLAVALLVVNGQWDPHLQILVNAGVQALAAVVLAAILWMAGGRRYLPLVAGLVALVMAAPFAVENSLNGFQSAFYFLLLFSILAIWLMVAHEPGTKAWWLGLACAFCSLFTVAGGLLVIAPIGLAALMRFVNEPRRWRPFVATLAALAMVAVVGYAGMSPPIPYHEALKATSAYAFSLAFARNLAFPWLNAPKLTLVLWLPLAILAAVVVWRRLKSSPYERLLFGLAAWVLCQSAAIAYSRGVDGVAPTSRYLDLLSLGSVLNTLAIVVWIERTGRRAQSILIAATCVWIGAIGYGVSSLSREMIETSARPRAQWSREHVRTVRTFLATDDMNDLLSKTPPRDLPYHSAWMLANWLQHPYVRRVMPAVVRPPLALVLGEGSAGFSHGQSADRIDPRQTFDSYGDQRVKNVGTFASQPVACADFAHLRFEVAGAAKDSGLDLGVRDANGRESRVWPPPGTRSGWTGTFVRCPAGGFTVFAADSSALSWMAFTPPSEIAWASMLAGLAIERTPLLGITALLCGALAVVTSLAARSKRQQPAAAAAHGSA